MNLNKHNHFTLRITHVFTQLNQIYNIFSLQFLHIILEIKLFIIFSICFLFEIGQIYKGRLCMVENSASKLLHWQLSFNTITFSSSLKIRLLLMLRFQLSKIKVLPRIMMIYKIIYLLFQQ